LFRGTALGDGRTQVGEAVGVHRLSGGVQFYRGPPAVFADVVLLRGAGGGHVGVHDAGEEVPLDLADFTAAHEVVLTALGELRARSDGVRGAYESAGTVLTSSISLAEFMLPELPLLAVVLLRWGRRSGG
jgi:hypothetical protein